MGKFDFHFSATVENDKRKKEKEILENEYSAFEFQKIQKKMREKIKTKEELDKLKDLVDAGVITKERAEKILNGENLNSGELCEILEKIDELSKIASNRKILPRDFKITQEEYLEAITNFDKKVVLLGKIDEALDFIYQNIGGGGLTFSLFSFLSYNLILSKDTQKIQGNLIDIKNDIINTKTL